MGFRRSTVFFLPPELLEEVFARKRFSFLELDTIALVCRQWRDEARLCQDSRTPVPRLKYRSCLFLVMRDGQALRKVSPILLNDREIVCASIEQDSLAIVFTSPELRDDLEMALFAVANYGLGLKYISLRLQADREVVMTAVRQNGYALSYASADLRSDREIVWAAMMSRRYSLQFASLEIQRDTNFLECFSRIAAEELAEFLRPP